MKKQRLVFGMVRYQTIPVEFGLESIDIRVDMTIAVKPTDKGTGDMHAVDWNVMAEKWHHLKDIKIPNFGKRPKIDLLIGIYQADLHYSQTDICGKTGDPLRC